MFQVMTRTSLYHVTLAGCHGRKEINRRKRCFLTTNLELEGGASFSLTGLTFFGMIVILCVIHLFWRRKKPSYSSLCYRTKSYSPKSTSKNIGVKFYLARHLTRNVLAFKKMTDDVISWPRVLSNSIIGTRHFDGYRANLSQLQLLLSGDVELNPGPYTSGDDDDVKETLLTVCDRSLAKEDWNAVVSAIEPIKHKWRDIGRKLGLHHSTIEVIANDNREKCGPCLDEAIAQWLQLNYITGGKYSDPSWRALAEVVAELDKRLFYSIANDHRAKSEESIPTKIDQPNLSDQAETSAEEVEPKPLHRDRSDDKAVKFPWEFIPALTYPGLLMKENLSKEQSEKYEIKLKQNSEQMMEKFNQLTFDIYEYMTSKKVPVFKLKMLLRSFKKLDTIYQDEEDPPTISKDVMKANGIDDMMLIIQSYCSFFNFHLIETIVDTLKLDGFRPLLEQYKKDFAMYAEHKLVYCCPSGIGFNAETGLDIETTKIVVKLDDAYKDCRMSYLETLRKDLCRIFRIPLEIFPLEGIQPGSVCVVFHMPEFMKNKIFPLSDKQIAALKELNYDEVQIYSIVCGEDSYNIKEKQPYAGSDSGVGSTYYSKIPTEREMGSDSGIDASYFVTKTMGLEYIKNLQDKFLQMGDKAIQLSTMSEMHMKAIEGDLESIREMIDNEATDYNPMNRDEKGNTALHYAAGNGHLHIVTYFVEELGFNCAITRQDDVTPLHCAASKGHQNIVQYLLDVQQIETLCYDHHDCTPLHYASREGHIEVVKQLVDNIEQYLGEKQESNSFCLDEEDCTPLHLAAVRGHLSVVRYFVEEKKCDPNCKNIFGNTPLHVAAACGHLEVVRYFISDLNGMPEVLNDFGHNALHSAVIGGQLNIVRHLIETEDYALSILDTFNLHPLHIATLGHQSLQCLSIVMYLTLDKECDPLCRDKNGNTPLHLAALNGHMEVVEFFISSLNSPPETLHNKLGQNPLHAATIGGQLSIVQYLIEKEGFNPSCPEAFNCTPLHFAACNGHLSIVEYLTQNLKCNPLSKDISVATPLQHDHIELAISNMNLLHEIPKKYHKGSHSGKKNDFIQHVQNMIERIGLDSLTSYLNRTPEKLLKNSPNVLQCAVVGGHLDVIQYLIKEGHDPACLDEHNNTLLHVAARIGHLSIVKYLTLDTAICDPMCRDKVGNTPLHLAALFGHMEVLQFLISDMNCPPETQNTLAQNSLHAAAIGGHLNILQHLIEKEGSNPFCPDVFCNMPLNYAAYSGHLSIIEYLLSLNEAPVFKNMTINFPFDQDNMEIAIENMRTMYESLSKSDSVAKMGKQYNAVTYSKGLVDKVGFESLISYLKCTPTETLIRNIPNVLQSAVFGGHLNIVRHLVEKGHDPSCLDANNNTLLHMAAQIGHFPVVKYLTLEQFCDPMCSNISGNTPLHLAALFGHMEVIQFLISNMNCTTQFILNSIGHNALHVAVMSGNVITTQYLIEEEGYSLSCMSSFGSLLHLAAGNGHLSIIKYLILNRKCGPMCKDLNGNTPLHVASHFGHVEIVRFLNSRMTCPSRILNANGHNALHVATMDGNLSVIQHLIEEGGYDLSGTDAYGYTLLHLAAAGGHLSVVKYLTVDKKCDSICKDSNGNTPLHLAVQFGHIEVAQFLISELKCTPEILNNDGRNALHVAVICGNLTTVRCLIEKEDYSLSCRDVYSNFPLHLAAANGHLSIIKYLVLDKECDPMCKDVNGNTPLHLAAFGGHKETVHFFISKINHTSEILNNNGHNALHVAVTCGKLVILQHLIQEEGYNLSCLDVFGNTLLHLAAAGGHLSIVKYLTLDKECDTMCKDKKGDTPLHLAAKYGHMKVLKFLISKMNRTSEILNNDGHNALHVAVMGGNLIIVQHLISVEGYNPYVGDAHDVTPLHYASFTGHLDIINYLISINPQCNFDLLQDYAGYLPIHYAVRGGHLDTIKYLEHVNNPHSVDKEGRSCLHIAAEEGRLEVMKYLISRHSFNPSIKNCDQVTPLHLSSLKGHLQVITYLIFDKGCDPLCRDKSRNTPLHWAASEGRLETVKFFIEMLNLSPFIEGENYQTVLGYAEFYGHDEVVNYIMLRLEYAFD